MAARYNDFLFLPGTFLLNLISSDFLSPVRCGGKTDKIQNCLFYADTNFWPPKIWFTQITKCRPWDFSTNYQVYRFRAMNLQLVFNTKVDFFPLANIVSVFPVKTQSFICLYAATLGIPRFIF